MKTLESVLTKEEARFVRIVYSCNGLKLDGGVAFHWEDDGSEYGKTVGLWSKPEELGLIECVGNYSWVPTKKLSVVIVDD